MARTRLVALTFIAANVTVVSALAQTDSIDATQLLENLRINDAAYQDGVTAGGTLEEPASMLAPGTPGRNIQWALTLTHGRIARTDEFISYMPTPITDAEGGARRSDPGQQGNVSTDPVLLRTFILAEDFSGMNEHFGGGYVSIEKPTATAYYLQLNAILMTLGRGYSQWLEKVTEFRVREDGRIEVSATGTLLGYKTGRWEMVVDKGADFMVRSARFYPENPSGSSFVFENTGIQQFELGAAPISGTWTIRGSSGWEKSTRIHFQSVEARFDAELFEAVEQSYRGPFDVPTRMLDNRVDPPLMMVFHGGDVGFQDITYIAKGVEVEPEATENMGTTLGAIDSGEPFVAEETSVESTPAAPRRSEAKVPAAHVDTTRRGSASAVALFVLILLGGAYIWLRKTWIKE